MVSRRNFFIITILMSVIFFLCLFVNELKDWSNDYEVNAFVTGTAEDYPSKVSMYIPDSQKDGRESVQKKAETGAADEMSYVPRGRVVCIGDPKGELREAAEKWALYTKRDIDGYDSLTSYNKAEQDMGLPEMLVIDSEYVDWDQREEAELLTECVTRGIHLIFATLPEPSVIKRNAHIRELLGIREVEQDETTAAGIHLYSGFLLGGEMVYKAEEEEDQKYQDMELTFPWYSLASGTKVYMKGIPEDEEVEKEDYPVLIWRKSFGSAYVFAVNGGYMQGIPALGLLSAMSSEMYPYEIYPVINAQNIVLAGYPGVADENRAEMEKYYGRSIKYLFQENIWPSIDTTLQDHQIGLTCMAAPQYDYSDQKLPDPEQLRYYMKILHERSAELGLYGRNMSDTPMDEKLSEDQKFIKETADDYQFASFYAGDMDEAQTEAALGEDVLSSVRTVVRDYDEEDIELIGYMTDHITEQRAVVNGPEYSYSKDFRMRSAATALGYYTLCCDMGRIAYPEDAKDTWDELATEFVKNVDAYAQAFQGFAGATAAQCDVKIRSFLALDYTESRTENEVRLQISGTEGPTWFVFRTYKSGIEEVEGGDFQELEDGAYLIEAKRNDLTILLKPVDERFYY